MPRKGKKRLGLTLNDLILEYKKIRKEYGDKAKSSIWIEQNGFGWIKYQAKKSGLRWVEFKEKAGFKEEKETLNDLIDDLQEIHQKHGDKCLVRGWLIYNSYSRLSNRLIKLGVSWVELKKKAGFKEKKRRTLKELITEFLKLHKKHGEQVLSSCWIIKNDNNILYLAKRYHGLRWVEFKEKAGFKKEKEIETLEDLITEYKKIYKKHGHKTLSSVWMSKNRCLYILNTAKKRHSLSWPEFKEKAGFKKPPEKTLKDLISDFKEIHKKHGDKCLYFTWIIKNYNYIPYLAKRNYGLSWPEFKQEAEFKVRELFTIDDLVSDLKEIYEKHGDKALINDWIKENYVYVYNRAVKLGFRWTELKKKAGFKVREFLSVEDIITEYKKIYKKHGNKALGANWLDKNKYSWIGNQIRKHDLSWSEFKRRAGFKPYEKIKESLTYQGFSEAAIRKIIKAMKEL